PLAEAVAKAAAAITVASAKVAKAQLVVNECTVRAQVDGTVEQISAVEGLVVGPSTRAPLVYLVPKGTRIVRAEVVPDFAYKIAEKVGAKVTISDDNNTSLTYPGEVIRVGNSFLPKRNGGSSTDFLNGKATLVLELVVEVKDAAPPGKPPLRVGQPVRVSIP
ncbi:MAG: HlyD family efflux transporter periplasmic adaptor subunit, partial [Gemmataceae bacterium]